MTNPDNVGGLPEPVGWRVRLSERGNNPWGPSPWHLESSEPKPSPREFYDVEQLHTADQMRAYGELCRAAPAGGDGLRLLVKELRETALRSVNLRDGQGMQDAYNDCADRLESAINDFGVVRDNERQPQGTTSGGSPDYSRITPPVSANAVGEGPCQKCHGTLEVLTNHAEPWSASAYSPCPDCHPAAKKDSAPAGSGEVGAWMHEDDPSRVVSAVQKESNLRDGGASASSMRPYSIPLLRKLQQGADASVPRECPSRFRCDCLGACKYGLAGGGAASQGQEGGHARD